MLYVKKIVGILGKKKTVILTSLSYFGIHCNREDPKPMKVKEYDEGSNEATALERTKFTSVT